MGVDKSYGSGKPRSAANSSMRRRVAAGQLTKGKKPLMGMYEAGPAKKAGPAKASAEKKPLKGMYDK